MAWSAARELQWRRENQRVHVGTSGDGLMRLGFEYPEADEDRCTCGQGDTWLVLHDRPSAEGQVLSLACCGCNARRTFVW